MLYATCFVHRCGFKSYYIVTCLQKQQETGGRGRTAINSKCIQSHPLPLVIFLTCLLKAWAFSSSPLWTPLVLAYEQSVSFSEVHISRHCSWQRLWLWEPCGLQLTDRHETYALYTRSLQAPYAEKAVTLLDFCEVIYSF